MIILKIITHLQPAARLPADQPRVVRSSASAYAVWTIATQSNIPNGAVLLIMLAVVVFLVGLVSEQISALRFEGRQ